MKNLTVNKSIELTINHSPILCTRLLRNYIFDHSHTPLAEIIIFQQSFKSVPFSLGPKCKIFLHFNFLNQLLIVPAAVQSDLKNINHLLYRVRFRKLSRQDLMIAPLFRIVKQHCCLLLLGIVPPLDPVRLLLP